MISTHTVGLFSKCIVICFILFKKNLFEVHFKTILEAISLTDVFFPVHYRESENSKMFHSQQKL